MCGFKLFPGVSLPEGDHETVSRNLRDSLSLRRNRRKFALRILRHRRTTGKRSNRRKMTTRRLRRIRTKPTRFKFKMRLRTHRRIKQISRSSSNKLRPSPASRA